MANEGRKIIAANKKAYHDYLIFDKFKAGIVLFGTEIKSIRKGAINLKDSFAKIETETITTPSAQESFF